MALFDKINSRYTKSMADGGSYERDAALGGYDRKELRGLGKQAKRGTLTQRERARYKYLKDERGGRRKRGLLAGLGGAGATLAALAAAGKLGGGGGEGGAALMDAIKSRLAGAQEKSRLKKFRKEGSKELQDMFKKEAMSGDIPASGDYDPMSDIQDIPLSPEKEIIEDELYSSNVQQPSELDILGDYGLLPEGSRKVSQDASRTQEVSKLRDILNKKSSGDMPGGPLLDSTPVASGPFQSPVSDGFGESRLSVENARKLAKEMAKRQDEKADEEMDYLNFKGMLKQDPYLQKLLRYGRFNKGGKIDEGSVKDLLSRLSKTESYDIDPENMTTGNIPPEKFLNHINKARLEKGLPEVDRISNQAINDMLNMKPLKPKQPSDIFNRYSNI